MSNATNKALVFNKFLLMSLSCSIITASFILNSDSESSLSICDEALQYLEIFKDTDNNLLLTNTHGQNNSVSEAFNILTSQRNDYANDAFVLKNTSTLKSFHSHVYKFIQL